MIYKDFHEKKLSHLGFGTMRLPQNEDGSIDEKLTGEMVAYALDHGVNYFDSAYPYHGGESERVIGKILKNYPRDSYYLATKYPGHQISQTYDPKAIFEEQLKKCGVEYFDFYLLHNVYENSFHTYTDPKWGIIDYFKEQKRLGKIRHFGFSTHGGLDILKKFLELHSEDFDFCQIQLNYLDWTLQDAKEKYELLTEYNLPVWVMEPVRGGRLASLNQEDEAKLKVLRPDDSVPSWGFRFLQNLPNVTMILSGMSNMAQMQDNVKTFSEYKPLSEAETQLLLDIADGMKGSIPCTGCRYCCDGCPKGLDIPTLLSIYNQLRFAAALNVSIRLESFGEDKHPSACIKCGKCAKICPQGIDIPLMLKELSDLHSKMPKWADLCRQREEAAQKSQR